MTKLSACVLGVLLLSATGVRGQDTGQKKPEGPIGDLVSVDTAKGLLTIKTVAGPEAKAAVTAKTEYLVVEPGKKSLDGATAATLADLKIGDRVWARGETAADGTVAARQVVVMSAEAIAERNKRDAQDWMRRGVRGEVHAVDAAKGEVTVETYRGDTVVVVVGTGTTLRRLAGAPNDLAHSTPIALADIKVGDQVAARGDRTADGARVTAESVFAGSFARPVGGRVTAVDAAKGEVRVTTRAGKDVTLTLGDGAVVRKLTPPARRPGEGGEVTGPQPPATGERAPAGGDSIGAGGAGGRGRGFGFGLEDRAELERRTTAITLADVQAGDVVFAVVEPGATDTAARVKVLVKLDLPADRMQRGPGLQGPPMGDPGADVPPNQ